MDEKTIEKLLLELGEELSANQESEAQAVRGYTRQLALILELINELPPEREELREYLDKLAAATEEKISDELNHQQSLLSEYVQLTGIEIAKE